MGREGEKGIEAGRIAGEAERGEGREVEDVEAGVWVQMRGAGDCSEKEFEERDEPRRAGEMELRF